MIAFLINIIILSIFSPPNFFKVYHYFFILSSFFLKFCKIFLNSRKRTSSTFSITPFTFFGLLYFTPLLYTYFFVLSITFIKVFYFFLNSKKAFLFWYSSRYILILFYFVLYLYIVFAFCFVSFTFTLVINSGVACYYYSKSVLPVNIYSLLYIKTPIFLFLFILRV